MKIWMLFINILTLLVLTACQGSKETVVEKHFVNNGGNELPVPPDQAEGGIDSAGGGIDGGGGGNGLEQKPLESFRIDLTQISAFQRLKTKVIDKLASRFPKLAADLLHIAEERSWYLIPTELKKLPAARIGVSFKTDQIALQKLKEIWIDDLIFAKMEPTDQETLLLHELLMGVRLLEFTNFFDRCLADISSLKLLPSEQEKYKEQRQRCFKKYRTAAELGDSIGIGKNIQLEDYDYESIRDFTNLLFTKIDTFDVKELEDQMTIRNFRKYVP